MLGPPNVLEHKDLLLEFLYVDSKDSDCIAAQQKLAEQPPNSIWRSQARSVALARRQVVRLEANNFPSVLDMPNDFPTISPWLGDTALWRKTWDNAPSGVVAGGQMRRFGRYLLAANLPLFDQQFTGALQAVRQRGQSKHAAVDSTVIHVIAGLAGGTGSGTFIDVVCRIRALTAGEGDVTILLYVVPPESGHTAWATSRNYYANGYAALLELNALLVGSFKPFDLSGAGQPPRHKPVVDNVFIITNQNSDNRVFDVERVIPELIAETIFQTVVLSGDASDVPEALDSAGQQVDAGWRKALTAENIALALETDDDVIDAETSTHGVRANRFLTFGLKRIAVPIEELELILSYTFLRSLFFQLLCNTWRDGYGFGTAALGSIGPAKVALHQEDSWNLAEAKLRLDMPSFERDPKDWKPAQQSFSGWIGGVVGRLKREYNDNPRAAKPFDPVWIEEIDEVGRKHFEEAYRGNEGAEHFYRSWERQKLPRAVLIRQQVEASLFADWIAGRASLQDTERSVEALIKSIEIKRARQEREAVQLPGEIAAADVTRTALRTKLQGMRRGIGRMVTSGKSALREIEAYAEATATAYAKRARLVGVRYAISLLDEIKLKVLELKANVQQLESLLIDATEICDVQLKELGLDDRESVTAGLVEHLFDRELTADVIEEMKADRAQQESSAEALRTFMTGELKLASFTSIIGGYSGYSLIQDLLEPVEAQVYLAHRRIVDPRKQILTGKVLERLHDLYRGQFDKLEQKIASWVGEARVFARFDGMERGRGSRRAEPRRSFVAFVPSAASLPEEKQAIRQAVVTAIRDGFGSGTEIVETQESDHEMTLLTLEYMFPLRMLTLLPELRGRYEEALNGPDARMRRLEIHLEGDGQQYPPLHMLPRRIAALPYWLLGEALDILEEFSVPGGVPQVRFRRKLPDGRTEYVVAGQRLSDRAAHIQGHESGLLRLEVTAKLRSLAVGRDGLKTRLIALDEEALQLAGDNHLNPSYLEIHAAIGSALSIVDAAAYRPF
jgi:hypothetical protein